jgi:hypothetical protein
VVGHDGLGAANARRSSAFRFTLAPAPTDMSSSMFSTDELALVPVVQMQEAKP